MRKQYNKKFIDKLIKDKPKSYNKPDFMKKVMELINRVLYNKTMLRNFRVKYGLPVLESSDIQQIVEKMKEHDSRAKMQRKKAYWDAVKDQQEASRYFIGERNVA